MSGSNFQYESNRNKRIQLSIHATKRCQQRGLLPDQIPLIKLFGEQENDGHGAIRYVMTKVSMSRLYRAFGHTKTLEKMASMYVVVSHDEETIITVAHLHQ